MSTDVKLQLSPSAFFNLAETNSETNMHLLQLKRWL